MSERLLSVGVDVGTTSTQLIVSELELQNRAGAFAVPELEIVGRRIRYRSPVHFTPLAAHDRVDGNALRALVEQEYQRAGIRREQVDTGAVIITGETSRKENAAAVLSALSDHAGEFVVATAGPDLESLLAAKGAGAVDFSRETGTAVLHMDIGGGTSNLALIQDGKIIKTGCLNVGGRLLKFDEAGRLSYVSPVLEGLWQFRVGETPPEGAVEALAGTLTEALEMAAGLRMPTGLLEKLTTAGTGAVRPEFPMVLSFSGGVADCIEKDFPPRAFGDLGPALGRAIRESRLCRGEYRLGTETIRATVIGAGCHSTQLSGSTVFHKNMAFPLKNLPVATVSREEQRLAPEKFGQLLRQRLGRQDGWAVAALPGLSSPGYGEIAALAEGILLGIPEGPVLVALEQDMAKALGQAIALRTWEQRQILCMDGLQLAEGSYLDVGQSVGPAMPVVIKTLILSGGEGRG